jgi:hypothetical protein
MIMKAVDTIKVLGPESFQPQAGHAHRELDLEWLLDSLEQCDSAAYRTISRTIEILELLSVTFIDLEAQLLHPTGTPDGLDWVYRSYFSMLDDSISLLFSSICQAVVPHLCSSCSRTSDSSTIQQEFDFSS